MVERDRNDEEKLGDDPNKRAKFDVVHADSTGIVILVHDHEGNDIVGRRLSHCQPEYHPEQNRGN